MKNQNNQQNVSLLDLAKQQQANNDLKRRYYVVLTKDNGARLTQVYSAHLGEYEELKRGAHIINDNGGYVLKALVKTSDIDDLINARIIKKCDDCGALFLNFYTALLDTHSNKLGDILSQFICAYQCDDGVTRTLCDDCEEKYEQCARCGRLIYSHDKMYVYNEYGEEVIYCDSCYNNHTWTCEDCGNIYTEECDNYECEGDTICEDCYNNDTNECADCGERFYNSNLHYIDDEYYCDDCAYTQREAICEYHASHSKRKVFYDANGNHSEAQYNVAYIGVEIETSHARNSHDMREIAEEIRALDPHERKFFIERDGSLDYGFEIIAQPFTIERLKDMQLFEAQNIARNGGMRAHDVSDCGLHVHISRCHFGNTLNKQYNTLLRVMDFYSQFEHDIHLFARREYNSYNEGFNYEWDEYDTRRDAIRAIMPDANGNGRMSRYYTINTNNRETIEFRGAKGSLMNDTLKATIGFYYYLVLACRELTSKDFYTNERINVQSVLAYMPDYVQEYLRTRNAFTQYLNASNPAQEVSDAINTAQDRVQSALAQYV